MRPRRLLWLSLAIGLVAARLMAQVSTAEVERLVDYVAPSLLATLESSPPAFAKHTNAVVAAWVLLPPEPESAADRRIRFEAEFGIRQAEPDRLRSAIRQAKYRLDETVFEASEWLESVERTLEWQYEFGRRRDNAGQERRPQTGWATNPLKEALENATVRADVDVKLSGRAFVGLRLELPIGP